MKLTVLERLILLNIIPREGDYKSIKIIRKLKEALSFDEKEHKLLKFRQEGQATRWEDNVIKDKEIEIGEIATNLIKETFKTLNTQKKITEEMLSLYEKFIPE